MQSHLKAHQGIRDCEFFFQISLFSRIFADISSLVQSTVCTASRNSRDDMIELDTSPRCTIYPSRVKQSRRQDSRRRRTTLDVPSTLFPLHTISSPLLRHPVFSPRLASSLSTFFSRLSTLSHRLPSLVFVLPIISPPNDSVVSRSLVKLERRSKITNSPSSTRQIPAGLS